MTLRSKLLALFVLLAAGPLLAIGVIGYVLSDRAVTTQLEGQTRVLASRTAEDISRRVRLMDSDLRLVGENAESERLLRLRLQGVAETDPAVRLALREAETFIDAAWEVVGPRYAGIELLDAYGGVVVRRGQMTAAAGPTADFLEYSLVAVGEEGRALGTVRAVAVTGSLLPPDMNDARFGRDGVAAAVHLESGRVLQFSDGSERTTSDLADAGLGDVDVTAHAVSGPVRASAGGAVRIGWLELIDAPQLAVVSLADRAEFEAPFDRQRTLQLALVLLLALAVLPAGWYLLRRATRSLDELTAAADRVGQGDFMPDLPPAGRDELGRLTLAFRTMTREIRSKVEEIERNRQLAAVGEFAAELSHEIRNPLTAIKLNLQRIERMVERSGPAEAKRPLQVALQEIARLDRVVRGTLQLGRPAAIPAAARKPLTLRDLVDGALEGVREQLAAQSVALEVSCEDAITIGDAEVLTGALLNLVLNAADAMPGGGKLRVSCRVEDDGMAALRVSDTGSGIPEAMVANLYRPFATTKRGGTGLGLALAHRAAEDHGGELTLEETGPHGTTFLIRLPAFREVPA